VTETTRDDNGSLASGLTCAVPHAAVRSLEKPLKKLRRSADSTAAAPTGHLEPGRAHPTQHPTPTLSMHTEVLMDPLKRCGAIAAALFTLTLAACGGGSSASTTTTTSGSSSGGGGGTTTTQAVQGVSTPSSVSVVTAKNAP